MAIERWWRGSSFAGLRTLAQIVLGLACWYAITLTAALTHQFYAPVIRLAAAVSVVAALAALARPRKIVGPLTDDAPPDSAVSAGVERGDDEPVHSKNPVKSADQPYLGQAWYALLLALLLLPHLIRSTSPVVSWDGASYHLTLPRRLLQLGTFPPVEWLFYGAWPQFMELLYGAAMAVRDHMLAKGLHAAAGVLWIGALLTFGSVYKRRLAGMVAALMVLASPLLAYELPLAYVDLAQSALVVLTLLFAERAADCRSSSDARAHLLIAGLAGGLLAGTKLIGIAHAAMIGALLLGRSLHATRGLLTPRDVILRYGLVAVALWLPWPIRSAMETGNPVFPVLTHWFGGPHWSPALAAKLSAWHSGLGMGREPIDWLLLPWRVTTQAGIEFSQFNGKIGPHWLAGGALALFATLHNHPLRAMARRLVGISVAMALMWALTSQQARLLLPALGPLAVAAGLGLQALVSRLPSTRHRQAVGATLVLIAAVAIPLGPHRAAWSEANELRQYKAKFGHKLVPMAMPQVARFVAARIPDDAKILMLHTNQAFWIGRDVIADSTFGASQIDDWMRAANDATAARRMLTEAGVTHVLSALARWPEGEALYPAALNQIVDDPARCRPLYKDREHRVCQLTRPTAETR
ncbi:MAG: hypothetical protein KC502_15525 [Myxococcales bacterium]|nr:hypothetical protein [Myxococcales bacterium]